MAIVKMKQFHLLALESQKDELLRRLQIFRNVEFKQSFEADEEVGEKLHRENTDKTVSMYVEEINKCSRAIETVQKYVPSETGLKAFIKGLPNYTFDEMEKRAKTFDFDTHYSELKEISDKLEGFENDIRRNKEEVEELTAFSGLDVAVDVLGKLKATKAELGSVPLKSKEEFEKELSNFDLAYFEQVGTDKDNLIYLVAYHNSEIEEVEEVLRLNGFTKASFVANGLPKTRIENLEAQNKELLVQKEASIKNIQGFAQYLEDFQVKFEYLNNVKLRYEEEKGFLKTDKVCLISGYCPLSDEKSLQTIASDVTNDKYYIETEDVDRESLETPIMLKNSRLVKAFESVTSTYAMPKYNEIDPTPLYAPIYALFFGMMAADVGYGLVLVLLTTLGLKLANLGPAMKQNFKFFQLIGISAAIWGFLYGSYFGASIPGMWRLFDLGKDFMTILVISIAMGGVHLFYGLAIKGYMLLRDGDPVSMIFDVIGWYVTLIGIIVFILGAQGVLAANLASIGKYTMIIGIVMLIIGGARQSDGGVAVKIVSGLYNVYGISNYIGDFVSYSRLMALGMAGGYIAYAVNMIAGMVIGSGVLGLIAGIFILVFFHAFNLFLTCLGAYVHAIRLIYVEFFSKFYEGGGKAFKVFRNTTKYINLDRHFEE